MKELYISISNLCLFVTVITTFMLLLSLLAYPIKLMYHRYKVNKIKKEFPEDQPAITTRYPSNYLDLNTPAFIDFIQWFRNSKVKIKVLVAVCAIIGILNLYSEYFGNDTIYSVFSRNEFHTQYYVQLFPEESKSKNYLVPADLIVNGESIWIEKVYWPNGGYTTFDRFGDMDGEEFYLNKHINIQDDEDRYWTIILTDIKVQR